MNWGWLTVGKWHGAPIRLHFTILLLGLWFGGLRFVPGIWVAFCLVVLIHEMGHAFLVRRFGHTVLSIDVHGLGGWCRWAGISTPYERAVIACGGVIAQGILLVLTLAVVGLVGRPTSSIGAQVYHAFVTTNLWIMLFNMLPIPPLDGAEMMELFRMKRDEWRVNRFVKQQHKVKREKKKEEREKKERLAKVEIEALDQLAEDPEVDAEARSEAKRLLEQLNEEIRRDSTESSEK